MVVCGDARRTYGEVGDAQPRPGRVPRRAGARHPAASAPSSSGGRAARTRSRSCSTTAPSTSRRCSGAFRARAVPFNVNQHYRPAEIAALFADLGVRAVVYHRRYGPLVAAGCELRRDVVLIDVDDGSGVEPLPGARPTRTPSPRRSTRRCRCRRPTTSTSSAPAAPPAGRRRCCGARPTSTSRPWPAPRAPPPSRSRPRPGLDAGGPGSPCRRYARRRPVDRLLRPARRRHRRAPRRLAALRRRGDPRARRARAGLHDVDRRRRLRPARSSRSCGGAPTTSSSLVLHRHRRRGDQRAAQGGAARAAPPPHDHGRLRRLGDRRHGLRRPDRARRAGGLRPEPAPRSCVGRPHRASSSPATTRSAGPPAAAGCRSATSATATKTEATFPIIDGERVAIPGDRAQLLADGTIRMLGRDSMVVNTGGEKVFVEEVEDVLRRHPDVADALVVGRPSERFGQEVVAVVAPAERGRPSTRRPPGVRRRRHRPVQGAARGRRLRRRPAPRQRQGRLPLGARRWPAPPSTPPAAGEARASERQGSGTSKCSSRSSKAFLVPCSARALTKLNSPSSNCRLVP